MEHAFHKTIGSEATKLEYLAPRMDQPSDELLASGQLLAYKLQQTLNIEVLLTTFCEQASLIVPCQSVAFRNDEQQLFVYHGEKHENLCRYSLAIEEQVLGEIECSSHKSFSETDLIRLEHLISILLFPLRNALMYSEAIQNAQRDPLTGLANRYAFDHAMDTEISRSERHRHNLCMLVVDIDHFKRINDTYGHLAGDEVLRQVASLLGNAVRKEDRVFRYGGEEFVVLLSATDLPSARLTAERIRMELEATKITALGIEIDVTASLGISEWQVGESGNTFFHRADQALYNAKDQGRNQVRAA
ncbi:GGDEF domain-containing protein [Pleionea sediminis]|uniref:GGDEF domain-containing protein n=1 Tax=Pleionea sediminis TaxID=2569479 RepID=UPI001186E7E8|nr:GGDEF domain-containing protein [Pleionea sediminis]